MYPLIYIYISIYIYMYICIIIVYGGYQFYPNFFGIFVNYFVPTIRCIIIPSLLYFPGFLTIPHLLNELGILSEETGCSNDRMYSLSNFFDIFNLLEQLTSQCVSHEAKELIDWSRRTAE